MIKTLIIEDEKAAEDQLRRIIGQHFPAIEVIGCIDSIENSIEWFTKNKEPDLILMDIQLADGLSFEIFNHVDFKCPVIFTTAYEEYTLKAFKVNSIDYILKPVNKESLGFAVEKYKKFFQNHDTGNEFKSNIEAAMKMLVSEHKKRFVVTAGKHIKSIETKDIICFYSLEKATFLMDIEERSYDINYFLGQLEEILNPSKFFRINRKYIINIDYILDMVYYSKRKIRIRMKGLDDEEIFVSRNRVKDFRYWLEKG